MRYSAVARKRPHSLFVLMGKSNPLEKPGRSKQGPNFLQGVRMCMLELLIRDKADWMRGVVLYCSYAGRL